MKALFQVLRSSVMAVLVLAVVCCGIYPLVVFVAAQALFPGKANGSLIVDASGTVRGSALLGQQFTGGKYFNSRPSAAGNGRSEEHTSELQSHLNLVCRLLL